MSAPRRLTDEQIAYVKRVTAMKRRIAARLKRLPTAEQLAEEFHVSSRAIERYASVGQTDSSTGNKTNRLADAVAEVNGLV